MAKKKMENTKENGKHEGKLIEKNVKFNEFKRQHDPPIWKISEKLPRRLRTGIP